MSFFLVSNGSPVQHEEHEAIVPWWSFTKTVLSAAALSLVRDGLVRLDDVVLDGPFTLRQLLRHEAGLADYGELSEYHTAVARGEAPWTADEMLERLDAARLRYVPGVDWRYSNVGYMYVARLIERVTTYARSPYATEGCVALANDDMAYLMRELEPRRTPVIIADEVNWVRPDALSTHRAEFRELLSRWKEARLLGDRAMLQALSTRDLQTDEGVQYRPIKTMVRAGKSMRKNRRIDLKDVSIFRWKRGTEVTVVNFAEVVEGETRGVVKRQYWGKDQEGWKLFYEGVTG